MIKLQHVNFRTDAFVGPFRYCVSLGPIMLPPLNSLNQTFNVHGILRCFTIFMSPPPIIRHARSIDKLQRVQNILARVVVRAPWTSISLTISRDLHWLPVGHRITYKPCLTDDTACSAQILHWTGFVRMCYAMQNNAQQMQEVKITMYSTVQMQGWWRRMS